MFNFNFIEQQIQERLKTFFNHQARISNINPAKMYLTFRISDKDVLCHVFESREEKKILELKTIIEAFGVEFDQAKAKNIYNYMIQKSKSENIQILMFRIVVFESKGRIAVYIYDNNESKKKLDVAELLNVFYTTK